MSSTTVNINTIQPGAVNIGNGNTGTSNINSKNVNISNGTGGTTNIYSPAVFLGNGDTGTTTIYSPNTTVGTTLSGTTNIYSPTINIGAAVGSNISIGTNTGTTTLGTTRLGTLDAAVPATGIQIGNNITTGNYGLLGSASFTGNGYIAASNTARSGTFDIVTAGTGAVNLGSLNAPLSLRGSTITLNGTTNVATLDATAPATGMNIGNNITGGNFGLLGNASFTGNVYIATSNTARSGTFDIATAGTGTVSIGSLNATLALRGATTTLSSPLTLGASPTASTQLGGGIAGTFIGATAPGNIYSLLLPAGSWILVGNAIFPSTTFCQLSISATSNTIDNFTLAGIASAGGLNITRCINVSGANQSWYLVGNSGTTVSVTSPSFYAYRIG